MFERYTEQARRVIFFARYEASRLGCPNIETEHLLLGLLREDEPLANRFLSHAGVESIRQQIEGHTAVREKVSTSVDLPLSHECKRVLAFAAEEAVRLNHVHIGTEHLLLGLLREEECFAAEILYNRGTWLSRVREGIARPASVGGLLDRLQHGADDGPLGIPWKMVLASASWDGTVRVWDPFTGKELQTYEGHQSNVTSVAFSPDAGMLASGL